MKQKIEFDLFDTYIATIKNSVGTKVFREMYLFINGKPQEVSKNGRWACATFISSILTMFGLIKERHATMNGLIKDMEKNDWYKIDEPRIGAVIWWDKTTQSEGHEHAGFYIGNKKAISNSWEKKVPIIHGWKSGTTKKEKSRPIKSIWWHKDLEE